MDLKGIVPPTLTIFSDDGSVDIDRTRAHLRFVIDRGVHGVLVLGTNGEMPLLNFNEKIEVMENALEEVNRRVPVIIGVGCPGTKETILLAKRAEAAGADAIAVITPYFYPLQEDGLFHHYNEITLTVDLPVFIYHNPQFTGCWISLETLHRIAEIPTIAGIKDSSGDIEFLYKIRRTFPGWRIFVGSDTLIFPSILYGIDGAVAGLANAFPELVVELYEALVKRDLERAAILQDLVTRLNGLVYNGPFLAGIKAALSWRGFPAGQPRSPLVGLKKENLEDLEKKLSSFHLKL